MADIAITTAQRGFTVLVVDDQEGVRHVTAAMLEVFGYRVLTAPGAADALAITCRQPIDLVLTDIVMPGMSGLELGRRLAEARPALPVVYMSGNWDEGRGGPDGQRPRYFVSKPFSARELTQCLEAALDGAYADVAVSSERSASALNTVV